jgi:hypothetical protein
MMMAEVIHVIPLGENLLIKSISMATYSKFYIAVIQKRDILTH